MASTISSSHAPVSSKARTTPASGKAVDKTRTSNSSTSRTQQSGLSVHRKSKSGADPAPRPATLSQTQKMAPKSKAVSAGNTQNLAHLMNNLNLLS